MRWVDETDRYLPGGDRYSPWHRPGNNTPITIFRWWLGAKVMWLLFAILPRGDARDALGEHVRSWCAQCRVQWELQNPKQST